jgi:hypothetical protein
MSKPNKKQRHKAKREAKRKEIRRRESVSPIKRLADAKGEIECWMSDGFGDLGQLQILTYKRAAGLSGVACFLVDRGVVGLKDAWTKLKVDREEFDFMVEKSSEHGIPMRRGTLEEARRWVAGGMRWAHDNGMRLPKDWAKVAAIIGGAGDWAKADVSEFVMEFAGRPEDLRQRLIGQPFEEFIRRTDMRFVFSDSAPMMDISTGEYEGDEEDFEEESILDTIPEDVLRTMLENFAVQAALLQVMTADWLHASNTRQSSELFEAWRSVMIATALASYVPPDNKRIDKQHLFDQLTEELGDRIEDHRYAEYDLAVDTVLDHLAADPQVLDRSLKQKVAQDRPVERFIDVQSVES